MSQHAASSSQTVSAQLLDRGDREYTMPAGLATAAVQAAIAVVKQFRKGMSPPMRSLSVLSHPISASWMTSSSLLERISPGEQPHPLEFQEPLNQKPPSERLLHRPLPPPTGNRLLSMVIALSMSRACQPQCGALLLCMVVIDSIHRTCKSDVSALPSPTRC
jgi:hypothetical protein